MQNCLIRIAFAVIFLAAMTCASASAQNRGYGGSSRYSGSHYQGAHSGQSGMGYHSGARSGSASQRMNGAYSARSYTGGNSHPSGAGAGRNYGNYSAHSSYSASRHHYSGLSGSPDRSASDGHYVARGSWSHMTMRPETQPHIGHEATRIGGFSSANSVRGTQVQHPTRIRQSRDTEARKTTTRVGGVHTAPSASTTKTYDKPINLASRNVSHMPGAGSHPNQNP